jgi:hypothetical protein
MNGSFPLVSKLPPLKRRKNPVVAALVGFMFGSVGLGIYLRSLVDFVAPLVVFVMLVVMNQATVAGWLVGALIAGAYGFCRTLDSNERLAPNGGVVPVAVVTGHTAGNR